MRLVLPLIPSPTPLARWLMLRAEQRSASAHTSTLAEALEHRAVAGDRLTARGANLRQTAIARRAWGGRMLRRQLGLAS